ncbi:hypothetical protein MMC06_004225 [Schaereria dolodes]|nr:hypothetical protein [Schaereria dolodes]
MAISKPLGSGDEAQQPPVIPTSRKTVPLTKPIKKKAKAAGKRKLSVPHPLMGAAKAAHDKKLLNAAMTDPTSVSFLYSKFPCDIQIPLLYLTLM